MVDTSFLPQVQDPFVVNILLEVSIRVSFMVAGGGGGGTSTGGGGGGAGAFVQNIDYPSTYPPL